MVEIVYSRVDYWGKDVHNATFWKDCYHPDEMTPNMFTGKRWFKYFVKFDGLKPIMITKKEEV